MKASENGILQTEPGIAALSMCRGQKCSVYETNLHCNRLPGMFFPPGISQSHVFPRPSFEISGRVEFLRTEFQGAGRSPSDIPGQEAIWTRLMVAILHPTGPGMQIPIDRAVVLIGRSPECDVVLDVSSKISRMHCALVQVDTAYYIRDLGSLNGVTVAGERVEKDVKLTNGTEVLIGDVRFLFLENVLPAARAAKAAPAKGNPVFIDETIEVLEVDEVEVVEPIAPRRPVAGSTPGRMPTLQADVDDLEIIDAEVLEDVDIVEAVEIVEDFEIIENVEVVADGDIIEDVEIVEDVDVIEDVEVIDEPPRRSRPRPRLR